MLKRGLDKFADGSCILIHGLFLISYYDFLVYISLVNGIEGSSFW